MSTIPSDLTVPYAFNIGDNKVTYIATDPNNLKVICSFTIVVQGKMKTFNLAFYGSLGFIGIVSRYQPAFILHFTPTELKLLV